RLGSLRRKPLFVEGDHCPQVWQARSAVHGGCGLFGRIELVADQVEPPGPEARVREVEPGDRRELLRAAAPTGAQQLDVARDERLALFEVAPVDRQREQLAIC